MIPLNFKNYFEAGIISLILLLTGLKYRSILIINIQLFVLLWWYLRDVKRHFTKNNQVYFSPVDGIVRDVTDLCVLPGYKDTEWKRITIETGFFDSHIQYAPISGEVVSQDLHRERRDFDFFEFLREKFSFNASISFKLPVSYNTSLRTVILDQKTKNTCVVEQTSRHIFGTSGIAPKLVDQGGKIGVGHISSVCVTTEVYIPLDAKVHVLVGQTMVGSETVLACHGQSWQGQEDPKSISGSGSNLSSAG